MFSPEDFQLPLEKKLKLRVITDEIEHCTSVNELQDNLKLLAEQNMTFQHMIGKLLKTCITNDLNDWLVEAAEEQLK